MTFNKKQSDSSKAYEDKKTNTLIDSDLSSVSGGTTDFSYKDDIDIDVNKEYDHNVDNNVIPM